MLLIRHWNLQDSAFFRKSFRFFRSVSGVFPALFRNDSGKQTEKKRKLFRIKKRNLLSFQVSCTGEKDFQLTSTPESRRINGFSNRHNASEFVFSRCNKRSRSNSAARTCPQNCRLYILRWALCRQNTFGAPWKDELRGVASLKICL